MKTHWLYDYIDNETDQYIIVEYDGWTIDIDQDASNAWSGFSAAKNRHDSQCKLYSCVEADYARPFTLDELAEKIVETLQLRDPPCETDSGPTVVDVLPGYFLPLRVKQYVIERQKFGLKKYGKLLRVKWAKADAYRKEEEGDWLAYAILSERKWLVTLVGWIFYFNWIYEDLKGRK